MDGKGNALGFVLGRVAVGAVPDPPEREKDHDDKNDPCPPGASTRFGLSRAGAVGRRIRIAHRHDGPRELFEPLNGFFDAVEGGLS